VGYHAVRVAEKTGITGADIAKKTLGKKGLGGFIILQEGRVELKDCFNDNALRGLCNLTTQKNQTGLRSEAQKTRGVVKSRYRTLSGDVKEETKKKAPKNHHRASSSRDEGAGTFWEAPLPAFRNTPAGAGGFERDPRKRRGTSYSG